MTSTERGNDSYLRSRRTTLAKLLHTLYPHRGKDYLNSPVKRWLDLAVSVPAAVVSTPIIAALALAKRLEDGGPAFFIQERLGRDYGQTINLVKIRCMHPNADAGAGNTTIAQGLEASEDPRNTRLGTFMRRYQLEELPQLFQVAQGQLSLLGIRPNPQYVFDYLQKVWSPERYQRWTDAYQIGPLGLSGLGQVFGSKLKEDDKRFHFDVFYAKNARLGLDLYLIYKTLTMLAPKIKLERAHPKCFLRKSNSA